MVGQGNAKPTAVRPPPAPRGRQQTMNAAGVVAPSMSHQAIGTGNQTSPKLPSTGQQNTEVLNQTRRLSVCPAKIAVGGLVIAVTIDYFTLYSKKKPEATIFDVAKAATDTGTPSNTRPRN